MPNPYTFVNWGLLGEGKEPMDGVFVKSQKIGAAWIGVYADPVNRIQADPVKVFFDKYVFIDTKFREMPSLVDEDFIKAVKLEHYVLPLEIAEDLGLMNVDYQNDKYYLVSEVPNEADLWWGQIEAEDRCDKLKEEYWHLLEPYKEGRDE